MDDPKFRAGDIGTDFMEYFLAAKRAKSGSVLVQDRITGLTRSNRDLTVALSGRAFPIIRFLCDFLVR